MIRFQEVEKMSWYERQQRKEGTANQESDKHMATRKQNLVV